MLRLLTFAYPGEIRLGALVRDRVVDLNRVEPELPPSLHDLVAGGEPLLRLARSTIDRIVAELDEREAQLVSAARVYPLEKVLILAPFPYPRRNVFCVGRNYMKHAAEGARVRGVEFKPPEYPEFFSKPPTSVVGHESVFPLDGDVTQRMDYEVELAVVIGRRGRNIPREEAFDHVFGYTVANDLSARDLQRRHGQWLKGKSLDNSCPMGPVVVPRSDIGDPPHLDLRMRVNGDLRQSSNTREMAWGVADILYYLSRGTTLEPGDVVLTGTPEGVGQAMVPPAFLKPGDVVEAEVEGIGLLRTHIVEA